MKAQIKLTKYSAMFSRLCLNRASRTRHSHPTLVERRKVIEMTHHKRTISVQMYVVMSLLALIVAACAPQATEIQNAVDTAMPPVATAAVATLDAVPPEVLLAAQQFLAQQLTVAADQVQLIEFEQAEWPDSCLGLGQANESCLAATTPGFRLVLEINGQLRRDGHCPSAQRDDTGDRRRDCGAPVIHDVTDFLYLRAVNA